MVKLLLEKIRSYARLRFVGLNTQNILNTASKSKINLKNVSRESYTTLEADVNFFDIKKLRRLLGENNYKISFVVKKGLMFALKANVHRACLAFGVALAIIAATVLPMRCWVVHVHGYGNTSDIAEIVKQNGMLDWHFYARGRIEQTQEAISASDNNILWNSISINGGVVNVYIKENSFVIPNENKNGNIIASKDCIVKNLIVLGGTGKVQNGQTVSAGQVLIENKITLGESVYEASAEGKCIASVWYYASKEIPLESVAVTKTGNEYVRRNIELFGIKASSQVKNEFESFAEEKSQINCFGLPLKIEEITVSETVHEEVALNREDAVKEAEAELLNKLYADIPKDARLYETGTDVVEKDGALLISVYIETVEDVAIRG